MSQVFKNGARTELDVGIFAATTQFTVIDGTIFPVANASVTGGAINQTSGDWFKLVLQDDEGNFEVVYCYGHESMTHTFTVIRGQEGTTARDFLVGTTVGLRLLSSDLDNIHSTLTLLSETKQEKTVPAAKADALTAARTISLTGAVQANATWDASGTLELVTNNIDVSKANGGTLVVGRGGTGATSHTAGQVLVGNGSNAVTSLAIDTTTSGTSASGSLITSGAVNAGLALKANLASPALTGTPTAPTATVGTNTTQLANTAFVTTAVSNAVSSLLGSAPAAALDTLKELGDALGNDPDFAATVTNALATKVDKVAGKTLTSNDFTDAERVKLANIAEQATKNATDAALRDRSTHTGTQPISTVEGLSDALANKPNVDQGAAFVTINHAEQPSQGGLRVFQASGRTDIMPDSEWWSLIRVQHPGYPNGYWQDLALSFGEGVRPRVRQNVGGTKSPWKELAYYSDVSEAIAAGNAATATKLQTARNLTIGSTAKAFDGSANVTWSLAEIGAAAASHTHSEYAEASHTHSYLPLAGGTLTGTLTSARVVSRAAGNDYHISSFEATGDGGSILPGYGFHQPGAFAGILQQNNASTFSFYTQGRASYAGLQVGSLYASGNVTAFSDRRLKKDLVEIDSALAKVKQLTGYTYTRIDTGERQAGLIAQDVQSVLPEVVQENADEYLSVAYGNLLALVINAVNELHEIVKGQKS